MKKLIVAALAVLAAAAALVNKCSPGSIRAVLPTVYFRTTVILHTIGFGAAKRHR